MSVPPLCLIVQRDSRQTSKTVSIPTKIPSRLGIVRVVALTGVFSCCSRVNVWHVSVVSVNYHSFADVVGELLDLFSDVAEECVARPSSEHHDCMDWHFA
jgi:hypothetical protein